MREERERRRSERKKKKRGEEKEKEGFESASKSGFFFEELKRKCNVLRISKKNIERL